MAHPARKKRELPQHDFADNHKLLLAAQSVPKRRLVDAENLRSSGEIAAELVREFCWDLGADLGWHRWMAEVSRRLGISTTSAANIIKGERVSISNKLVDKIARKTGVPPAVFYGYDD